MQLTDEQTYAVDLFKARHTMRLQAYAGAGKTSTLYSMAATSGFRPGLYIAFNKAIASAAAQKFAGTTTRCSTAHSLAFRHVIAKGYNSRKMTMPLNSRTVGCKPAVAATIRRFCQSADESIMLCHVPREVKEEQRNDIANRAHQVWQRAIDPKTPEPLGHDGYLKLWSLDKPWLPAEFIMVDEAQDLNPVLISVIENQSSQIIAVGDTYQSIYAWRGAVNAMHHLPGIEARLTQSFRFGPNIAAHASRVLATLGEQVPVLGLASIDDYVTGRDDDNEADAILCRTNSMVMGISASYIKRHWPVYVPGGVAELITMTQDAKRLMRGEDAQTPELFGFADWQEVVSFARTDEGADLRVFTSLIDEYKADGLLQLLQRIDEKPTGDSITISTAHKAKGLEWSSVRLAMDFAMAKERSEEEKRLLYVAMTRATTGLNIGVLDNDEIYGG